MNRFDKKSAIYWMTVIMAFYWGGTVHADDSEHHHHAVDHSAHMAQTGDDKLTRSEAHYMLPSVTMTDQNGKQAPFDKSMDDGRTVILNFIYTSCTAICPVMTRIFTQVQSKLGDDVGKVHMVSVSIDPEYDTPARLKAYTEQHGVGKQWDFYTGTQDASVAVQKALDAYRGDKMNHKPLTLLRAAGSMMWVRLDGFANPDQIVNEYRQLAQHHHH